MQSTTIEFDLYEELDIKEELSRTKYNGVKDSEFILDSNLRSERELNIEKYRGRLENGLDIFSGLPLPVRDLCSARGLGAYSVPLAIQYLSESEREYYKDEIKDLNTHFEDKAEMPLED